jgi:hypothetical protein
MKDTPLIATDDSEATKPAGDLQEQFNSLADRWEQETSQLSSPSRKAQHPAHQAIIEMGPLVVPLILRRMDRQGGHWFWALTQLAGENPIPPAMHGKIADMRAAWVQWGTKRGYC